MSELSLSRKVEKVLTAYMDSVITGDTLNIYEGHEKAEIVEFPSLVCYAENSQPHPDMPTSTGVRVVAMRFQLRVDSEDEGARAALDGWRMTVEDSMSDIDAIQTFIAASEIDWEGFFPHVYDTMPEDEPTEFEHTDWVEQFAINVICQLCPVPD